LKYITSINYFGKSEKAKRILDTTQKFVSNIYELE